MTEAQILDLAVEVYKERLIGELNVGPGAVERMLETDGGRAMRSRAEIYVPILRATLRVLERREREIANRGKGDE